MNLDEKKITRLTKRLKGRGITITQMEKAFDISYPTAYRWLNELRGRGFTIIKVGTRDGKFKIIED